MWRNRNKGERRDRKRQGARSTGMGNDHIVPSVYYPLEDIYSETQSPRRFDGLR